MNAPILDTPVLPTYPTEHGWRVWCCYCRRSHRHGAKAGHRAAHCYVATSPYRHTSYILELAAER